LLQEGPVRSSGLIPSRLAGWERRRVCAGFSLVELVMVLVVTGVLAMYAAPQLVSVSGFYSRGFHDETLALLRYAHQAAIAQRRSVCVDFGISSAMLTVDADQNSGTGAHGCEANLTGPRGDSPGQVTARGSVQYAATPTTVVFDGLGQPGAGQSIQVQGATNQIVIEAVTGYVHE
jgi:MSHA pilin protein MshC